MTVSPFELRQAIFVRRGTFKPWEDTQKARLLRRDLFTRIADDEEISFIVITLELTSGRIIRAVEDPDCLPFLDEVNEALEENHASAH